MFNFDLDDPKRAFLMQLAAGLLSGKNVQQGLGQGIPQGLLAYQATKGANDRRAEEAQQREMRQMQIAQMQRQQQEQEQTRALAGRAFGPNPNLVQNDDMGNPMPQAPGGGGMQEFAQGLMGINPMQALQFMPKPKEPTVHSLGPGHQLYDSTGKQIAAVPDKPDQKVGATREIKSGGNVHTYEWDGSQWQKIASAPQFKPDGPDKPDKPPAGYRFKTDGSLEAIKGGPADPASGKATDTERVAAGYHDRMKAAEKIMAKVGDDKGKPGVREAMMSVLPGGETIANAAPAIMGGRSAERQQYRQAQEDWVRAKLRKESGAVIADAEMDREIRTYFPQIGDTPQLMAQKAQARQVAIQAMKTGAGPVVKDDVDDLIRKYLGR